MGDGSIWLSIGRCSTWTTLYLALRLDGNSFSRRTILHWLLVGELRYTRLLAPGLCSTWGFWDVDCRGLSTWLVDYRWAFNRWMLQLGCQLVMDTRLGYQLVKDTPSGYLCTIYWRMDTRLGYHYTYLLGKDTSTRARAKSAKNAKTQQTACPWISDRIMILLSRRRIPSFGGW